MLSKSILLSTSALIMSASVAVAADLPSRRLPPAPPPPPAFSWTGFYFGANAGGVFDSRASNGLTANDALATTGLVGGFVPGGFETRNAGFTGGGEIGYNYAFAAPTVAPDTSVVVGVEADAAYTDLKSTNNLVGTGGIVTSFHERTAFLGTARGRVGLAFDRALLYGTGGFAYGSVRTNTSIFSAGGVLGYNGASDVMRTGYVVGAGVEYALPTTSFLNFFNSSAVTIKGEFLHYSLGSRFVPVLGTGALGTAGSSYTNRVFTDGNLVRLGLNFKFGAAPVPVVARY